MMNWMTPLGFLGLLAIAIIILIYLLKPNHQQKQISSTYVWKLSLRYRKKRLPINRFKNLLILLCQLLIVTIAAFILAQPHITDAVSARTFEKIVVIDASASMLAYHEEMVGGRLTEITRFERAVEEVRQLAKDTTDRDSIITVVLAGREAKPLFQRLGSMDEINIFLDEIVRIENTVPVGCTYGKADIDGAMDMVEDYLVQNPAAEVRLYTATKYETDDTVNVIDVAIRSGGDKEWNAAILDVKTEIIENYYRFTVEVASYNNDINLKVVIAGSNINDSGDDSESILGEDTASCRDDGVVTVVFSDLQIFSYGSIHVYIETSAGVSDSFGEDNHFYLYNSQKEILNMIYVSTLANNFYIGLLPSLTYALNERWDLRYATTSLEELANSGSSDGSGSTGAAKKLEGYDLYIIEYTLPEFLPDDGVIMLVNPYNPSDTGLVFGSQIQKFLDEPEDCILYAAEASQLLNLINPAEIQVRQYTEVLSIADYKPLMYFKNGDSNDPVLLLKNTPTEKILVVMYASWYSDFTLCVEFPTLVYNIFTSLLPASLQKYIFDVDEAIRYVQSQSVLSESLPEISIVKDNDSSISFDLKNQPYSISLLKPGTYNMTQSLINGRTVTDKFFVRVPLTESDFSRTASFMIPTRPPIVRYNLDLVLYFAIALVALLFIERLLHVKDEL